METTTVSEVSEKNKSKSLNKRRTKKSDFQHHLFIESYGVKIGVICNTVEGIEAARQVIAENLPDCFQEIENTEVEHNFLIICNPSEKDSLYKNDEKILTKHKRKDLFAYLGSTVRLTVAEFAPEHVFVHAGVVSWKGKLILIPGRSFSGKTTLTAALAKRGALYYSDEYAVIDKEGFVHPFPKTLSIRGEIDDYTQVEHSVESLGGTAAVEKALVSVVLITEYKANARWKPETLSVAVGIMELIKNTVSIRQNPELVLQVLNQAAKSAIFVKTRRNDTSKSVNFIDAFVESLL